MYIPNVIESPVNPGDSGGNEMETCLMILKLAMARLAEEDERSRAEKGEIMREHLNSCPSCTSFVEGLGISDIGGATDQIVSADPSLARNGSAHALERGDRVSLRSTPDRVGVVVSEAQWINDKPYYRVSFDPSAPAVTYGLDSLQPVADGSDPLHLLTRKEFATPSEFATFLILKKLETPLSDNLYTFYNSRTQFEAYQFKPVLKFLNSVDQRLLIADEVGLGKTIEAGIILEELDARLKGLSRVLIVCPATLVQKWQGELRSRFSEEFRILRSADVAHFLDRYATYGDAEQLRGICSQETLRRFTDDLKEHRVHFDLVVVDEAHHWRNPDTRLSELGEVLSEYADSLLMLTATPLHVGSENLFNLFRIMLPQQFGDFAVFQNLIKPNQFINAASGLLSQPDAALKALREVEGTSQKARFLANPYYQECVGLLSQRQDLAPKEVVHIKRRLVELNSLSHVFTRTKKRDVEVQFPTRQARTVNVEYSPEEMDFYNAVTDFVETRFTADWDSAQGISFARIMPQRQVASCIPAMRSYLKDQAGTNTLLRPRDWEGDDIGERTNGRPRVGSNEQEAVKRLLRAMDKLGSQDTKFAQFLDALQKLEVDFSQQGIAPKVIVFSYFKRTLQYLNSKLADSGYAKQCVMIHGDINPKIREKTVERFRDNPEIKILLSSEVGSEGLDFQFCNVMFNYDLPWNPMRVEQRIGRLDRYGQKSDKILIYNFSTKDTIDDIILERLYQRINLFERYIGDLEVILGDQIASLTREMFDPRLDSKQKADRAEQTAMAIENEIKEFEEFESQSSKFLGQDDFFNEEISAIKESKRFITSQEVQLLLTSFLGMVGTSTTLRSTRRGRKNIYVLRADEEFRRFFRAFSDGMNGREEVIRELEKEGGTPVTFEVEEASADRQLMFLTIHHPIIRSIVKYLSGQDMGLKPTAALRIESPVAHPGDYLYFIYMLEEFSLKKTLKLVPLLVNLHDQDVVHVADALSDQFIGLTPGAEGFASSVEGLYQPDDVNKCAALADEYIAMMKDDEETSLLKSNDTLVDARKEAINQSYSMKTNRVKQTLGNILADPKPADERLVRMYRARIRNLEDQLRKDEQELEDKRGVHVGFQLLASGFVRFEHPASKVSV